MSNEDHVVSLATNSHDGWLISAGRDGKVMLWESIPDSAPSRVCGFEMLWAWEGSRYYISTMRMTRSLFYCDGRDNVVLLGKFVDAGGGAGGGDGDGGSDGGGSDGGGSDGDGGSDGNWSDCS